ncbi:hypothetical protein [Candidatus Palauibacter sp.]
MIAVSAAALLVLVSGTICLWRFGADQSATAGVAAGMTMQDSAGIRIVTNHRTADVSQRRVEDTPFTPVGVLEELVLTPPDVKVTDAGEDWIPGVWKDELDIEYVRKYHLRR